MQESIGLTLAEARSAIEAASGRGLAPPNETPPFMPGAKRAMELALRASLEKGDTRIQPIHLLLGVILEGDGLGARILAERGLDAEASRRSLRELVRMTSLLAEPSVLVETEDRFRVVELTGDSSEWESQLNGLAELGYELFQIVERRAIFTQQ